MTVETDFVTAIKANSTISGLVATRLYPVKVPDKTSYPAGAYTVISQNLIGSNGCYQTRIQMDWYATGYSVIKTLTDATRALAEADNSYTFQINADVFLDEVGLYHQPIDIIIVHS